MADLITADDLSGIPGISGTPDELAYAARRASSSVAPAWCRPVDPPPQWVKDIAIDVAVRYLHNPRGTTSVTRRIDDASRTERYEDGVASGVGSFELEDSERKRLCPAVRRRVGSIRLAVPGYRS
jgi:hypothetical protein